MSERNKQMKDSKSLLEFISFCNKLEAYIDVKIDEATQVPVVINVDLEVLSKINSDYSDFSQKRNALATVVDRYKNDWIIFWESYSIHLTPKENTELPNGWTVGKSKIDKLWRGYFANDYVTSVTKNFYKTDQEAIDAVWKIVKAQL